MKILSYEIIHEMIYLKTDNPIRSDFTYFKDKFQDLDALKLEIDKSILLETNRDSIKGSKQAKVVKQLKVEVVNNA